ncbi:hypothetical protein CCAL6883_08200 [Campylobacter sp. RM6883]|uniref:hypothetical protein n=1 Tax=Campylobacter californiensis TaxID=1032243 RepID=UPI0014528BA7|nr:hypothetical protein [Campylobacter sp. RM6914]MBE2985316.1 hypothetical protein [Campylobacter sp. RM6883]MBE2995849.1 hypothetical protein [Campylobacter sp. RM6913]QCD51258.1 hypothetical protein CCAL_1373 [Campylobacter sp. RM6914]
MKTTKEMVEVMQAYERGEEIEFNDIDRPDVWYDLDDEPQWAWDLNDYRIKQKEPKFKDGDRLVEKSDEITADPCVYTYSVFLAGKDDGYAKFDDVLWYWEFKMSDGWHKSEKRMTKAEAVAFVGEDVEIAPLYGLGFRLPQ